MTIPYSLVDNSGARSLVIAFNGQGYNIEGDHPRFDDILAAVQAGDESFVEVVDMAAAVSSKLEQLSERVTLRGSTVFFDGDPIHDAFVDSIARFHSEGVDDWKPLVSYIERVYTNMTPHSRENLSRWVQAADLTITDDGMILAYKGVYSAGTDDEGNDVFKSCSSGHGFVDGVEYNGQLPQKVGSVVTMPRSEVTHDPSEACSAGLHAGTHSYARQYGNVMIRVVIDPRDVVSVPNDSSGQKIRVARYKVAEVASDVVSSPVYAYGVDSWGDDDEDDEDNWHI